MQTNKPDSVKRQFEISASSPFIWGCCHQQTLSTYPPKSGEQPLAWLAPSVSVYMVFQRVRFTLPQASLLERWALTPPFHLFPESLKRRGSFPFCGTFCCLTVVRHLPVRKYAALCCPDFPPLICTKGDEVVCAAKLVDLSQDKVFFLGNYPLAGSTIKCDITVDEVKK